MRPARWPWYRSQTTANDWHGPAGTGTYRTRLPIGTWDLEVSKVWYANPAPASSTVEITACDMVLSGQDFQFAVRPYRYLPLVLKGG
jgi:hypothetical protein